MPLNRKFSNRRLEHTYQGKNQGDYGYADDAAIHNPFVRAFATRRGCILL